MPDAPVRLCACGRYVQGGRCPACRRAPRLRGGPRARGYDRRWERLRDQYRAQHPLCELCLARGLYVPMRDVDHKIPFRSLDDPRRLDSDNLQSLCAACHKQKTDEDFRS